MVRTVVIGGGASGMMAAIAAAGSGDKVTLIEKNSKLGKKISATGNGKCNFTNATCRAADFFCKEGSFVDLALGEYGQKKTVEFFKQVGIYARVDAEGRMYPYSEQASVMSDALLYKLNQLGVKVLLGKSVLGANKPSDTFYVNIADTSLGEKVPPTSIQTVEGERLIIATGGKAGSQYGSTGEGYKLAETFGHSLVKPLPALVQLTSDDKLLKEMYGVRAKGMVRLYVDEEEAATSTGEIQFTEHGLSGICVFDVSRVAVRALEEGRHCRIDVDLIPLLSREELISMLKDRIKYFPQKSVVEYLDGLIKRRMQFAILRRAKTGKASKPCRLLSVKDVETLADVLKKFYFEIQGSRGWDEAQTTTGGISLEEVNYVDMASKIVPGLHFCGEILDVDGICGGLNLQWAWTSGYLAGHHAKTSTGAGR